jgi:small subunit ribosomal protein S6
VHEYELMYILHPRLTADEVAAAIERVGGRATSAGGEVLSVDNWGKRRLAYPIKHHFEGTYVLTTLRLPAEATTAFEGALRISEDVIRHLLVRGIIPFEGSSMQDERGRAPRPMSAEPEFGADRAPAAVATEARDDEPDEDDGNESGPEAEGSRADADAE